MEDIDNVAFIIPTYPPHYHYIYNLIDKLKSNNLHIDIFLIFSNQEDYNIFLKKDEIHHIIVNDKINTNSIITFKKFYGLKHLKHNSKYEYYIVLDSETDIIPKNFTKENINEKIKNIFNSKKIYAGDSKGFSSYPNIINSLSANLFPNEYSKLELVTNNFNLYFWLSDLPVYRRADLESFFEKVNYDNIVYEHFDHIIYQYYLILTNDFEIIDTTPITNVKWSLEGLGIWETQHVNVLNNLLALGVGFGFTTKQSYDKNPDFFVSNKTAIICHLDRNY